jgi:hypothetical protein
MKGKERSTALLANLSDVALVWIAENSEAREAKRDIYFRIVV